MTTKPTKPRTRSAPFAKLEVGLRTEAARYARMLDDPMLHTDSSNVDRIENNVQLLESIADIVKAARS